MDGLRTLIIRGQAGAYLNDDKHPRAWENLWVNIPCTCVDSSKRNIVSSLQGIKQMELYNGTLDETLSMSFAID